MMKSVLDRLREPSPTAGLPLTWRDFWLARKISRRQTLEQKLANYLGVSQLQIECSGTAALVVALLTLKKMSNRRSVVISAYTCPWVAIAVMHCGLIPVLCDTRKNHFELCIKSLAGVCNEDTLAIVPTHLAGRVARLDEILNLAKQVGAFVVEDAAQSLGATLHGTPVGLFGDIGFYSLGVGKGLSIFAGGVLVAKDVAMQQALQNTSDQSIGFDGYWEAKRILALIGYYLLYRPLTMVLVFGMPLRRALRRRDWVEAVGDYCAYKFPLHRVGKWRKAVGANALDRLEHHSAEIREQAMRRCAQLSEIDNLQVIADTENTQGVWPFILVLMPSQLSRDQALAELWHRGLGVGRLFIHALGDYDYLAADFERANTPNARDFAARSLIVTNSIWLSDGDFTKIYQVLKEQVSYAES